MKEAAVAIEDRRFYEHRGVDIQGMFRAGLADVLPGGSTQGASTITEQFVKNALEAQGNRTVIEAAARTYFGYNHPGCGGAANTSDGEISSSSGVEPCAKELTLPDAAMLAGIISSPSAFSPR